MKSVDALGLDVGFGKELNLNIRALCGDEESAERLPLASNRGDPQVGERRFVGEVQAACLMNDSVPSVRATMEREKVADPGVAPG